MAGLFSVPVEGGPVNFAARVPVALANRALFTEISAEAIGGVDVEVRLIFTVAAGPPTRIEINAETPLYYLTGALGFDSDAVASFATTLSATLAAYASGSKAPTFRAPPRPPPT